MDPYRYLTDLEEQQLEGIKDAYGISALELQFLLDFHARYFGTDKSFIKRLL